MWVSRKYIRETVMCRMPLNHSTQTIHLSLASSLLYREMSTMQVAHCAVWSSKNVSPLGKTGMACTRAPPTAFECVEDPVPLFV